MKKSNEEMNALVEKLLPVILDFRHKHEIYDNEDLRVLLLMAADSIPKFLEAYIKSLEKPWTKKEK